ncbi:MAG: hypothetical protein ACT4O2_11490 [Beijerinckiaceae bacterium]
MTNLFIVSVLLGAVLGRFFKVLVLVPVSAFILAATLVSPATIEGGLPRMLLEFALLNAGLQIGYLAGLLTFLIPSVSHGQGRPARARPLLRH